MVWGVATVGVRKGDIKLSTGTSLSGIRFSVGPCSLKFMAIAALAVKSRMKVMGEQGETF